MGGAPRCGLASTNAGRARTPAHRMNRKWRIAMARLSLVDVEGFTGPLGTRYDYIKRAIGRINTLVKICGRLPEVGKFLLLLPMTVQREGGGGVLSARIKEMVVLKTSFINGCQH
jgi:hypothetical protein